MRVINAPLKGVAAETLSEKLTETSLSRRHTDQPHQKTMLFPESGMPLKDAQLLNHLLNGQTFSDYHSGIQKGLKILAEAFAGADKPFSGIYPQELEKAFKGINPGQPLPDLDSALAEVRQLFLNDAVYFHHPKYMAHLNCPITIAALVGELIASSVNTAVETWDQSGGATLMEQTLINWVAEKTGFPGGSADGVFTSGGSQSNLMGLLLARDAACDKHFNHSVKRLGLPEGAHKLRIFASETSHFSIQKSASILGLGYDSVITVPCDRFYCMNPEALSSLLDQTIGEGNIPMAIVATAGTTDFGSIDPMPFIADLCKRYNIWMHVDAAYGGGLLLSQKHRQLLSGIESADSATIDFHKSFFQPVSCGVFLLRNKAHFATTTYHAEYLNPLSQSEEGTPNLINKSIQTTRRFDALKLWVTLRTYGEASIGQAFDQAISLARQAFLLLLAEPLIEVLHRPQLSTLVFRFQPREDYPDERVDKVNSAIRKGLSRSGKAVVAGTKIHGRQYLKFTLLNPATTLEDIHSVMEAIKEYGLTFMEQNR